MDLKELVSDDQAVSPVIGVILMVAITVILAAVIGTFVLGLGGQLSKSAPTASFQFDYQNQTPGDNLTIAHAGGDTIKAGALYVKSSAPFNATGFPLPNTTATSATWKNISGGNTEVSAGDTIDIWTHPTVNTMQFADDTIRVVWQATEGDSSAVLGKWSGPEAS